MFDGVVSKVHPLTFQSHLGQSEKRDLGNANINKYAIYNVNYMDI